MQLFHGTSPQIAQDLAAGRVDVRQGGGELGQGFYTGEYLHVAKQWALHRYSAKQKNVVVFDADDDQVQALRLNILGFPEATAHRSAIKKRGATRTHTFNCDMVWAPIVGSDRVNSEQHRWESAHAEVLLNSVAWPKAIV